MGYRSDIRILLPEADFNVLDKKLRELDDFYEYDIKNFRDEDADAVKEYAPQREPIRFVYFGWNDISWYDNNLEQAVEDAIYESEYYHFMRIGEEYSDIEEMYRLEEAWIDGISINRCFDDNCFHIGDNAL